jgi:hypothetical protein
MKTTIKKLILAAIVSIILITEATAGTQQSATLSVGWKNKNQGTNACGTGLSKGFAGCAVCFDAYLENLLDAIAIAETNGRNIMGDQNQAAGIFQLHRCALLDVNRKYGTCYEWPRDALVPHHARNIAKLYLKICGYGKKPLEETVRRYNGGGKHWQSNAAGRYWLKVKTILSSL